MVNDESSSSNYIRVNGGQLSQYHNKPICLVGTVLKADGGSAFQVKASDNITITIRLRQPISEPLSGILQICGTAQGKNLILADSFFCFDEAASSNFDISMYNECMNLMHTTDSCPWMK